MKGSIVFIDGVSNTGKTTLCTRLAEEPGITHIDEAPTFMRKRNQSLPPISNTFEDEIRTQRILLEVELERLKLAEEIASTGQIVVLDRSFVSTVSVAYSLERSGSLKGVMKESAILLAKYFYAVVNVRGEIPCEFIFLRASYPEILVRNGKRSRKLSDQWLCPSLIEPQNRFFEDLSVSAEKRIIDTTHLTPEEVMSLVKKEIKGEEKKI